MLINMGNRIQIRKTSKEKCKDLLLSSSSSPPQQKINFVFFYGEEFMALKSVRPIISKTHSPLPPNGKMAQVDAYYQLTSQLGQSGSAPQVASKLAGKDGQRPIIKIIVTRKQLSELLVINGGKGFQSVNEIKVRGRSRQGKWRPSLCSIPELS